MATGDCVSFIVINFDVVVVHDTFQSDLQAGKIETTFLTSFAKAFS